MITKISKHKAYDDPTAFSKARNFAKLVEDLSAVHPMSERFPSTRFYKMGKLGIITHNDGKYFLSVQGKDCYPSWDEIVWIRYNLIPDAAIMALLLPNLNSYINQEGNHFKFVFTMEQTGWALDPTPTCEKCGKPFHTLGEYIDKKLSFFHLDCGTYLHVDPTSWNESHGNGKLASNS